MAGSTLEFVHREHETILAIAVILNGSDAKIMKLLVPVTDSLLLKRIFRIGFVQNSLSYLVSGSVYNISLAPSNLKVLNNHLWLGSSIVLSLIYP